MSRTTAMTVRLSGALSELVAANIGETSSYEVEQHIETRVAQVRQERKLSE